MWQAALPRMKMPIGVRGADFVPFSAIDFNQWLQGIFIADNLRNAAPKGHENG
jgi:hypothetical protein